MKRGIMILLAGLCVSGLCACGAGGQTNGTADTQLTQAGDTQPAESAENVSEEASENVSEAGEAKVLSFEPDVPMNYRGKDLCVSFEEKDGNSSIKLSYGDALYEKKDFAEWISTGYVMEIDDTSFYCLIQGCSSNDWVTSYIVKYDGNAFKEIAVQNGGVTDASSISGNQIVFETRVDLLGTYGVRIPMKLENDQLTNVEDLIQFVNEPDPDLYASLESEEAKACYNEEGYRALTLKRALTAMSEDGSTEIAEGEQIIPYGYKEAEKKFYFTYGGKQYYVIYDVGPDGYSYTIDGVDQDDQFVSLPYAG